MLHVYVQIQQNKIYNILYKKWWGRKGQW
jgi:hypothetical protein